MPGPIQTEGVPSPGRLAGTRPELLVFDDHPPLRATLASLLSPHFSLDVALTWDQATRLARDRRPWAGLVGLPSAPAELRERLSALQALPLPLILLVKERASTDSLHFERTGQARTLLSAPFSPAVLRARVRETILSAQRVAPPVERKGQEDRIVLLSAPHRIDPLVIGIAHRLNTFLVSVKTLHQLWRASEEAAQNQSDFDRSLEAQMKEIEVFLEDLSAFVEARPGEFRSLSIAALLQDLQAEGQSPAESFVQRLPEGLPWVWSDPEVLGYAIRMLLAYFFKSGAAGVEVRAEAGRSPAHPASVVVEMIAEFPAPPSELESRVLGLYVFLARETLLRIGLDFHHSTEESGRQRMRVQLPTRPPVTRPPSKDRWRRERGKILSSEESQ